MNPQLIRTHEVVLEGQRVRLRPLSEEDWPALLRWNSDPKVLYYSEGADVKAYSLDLVQRIYRSVSQTALCFMIELNDRPVGECWLQQMNLDRVKDRYLGLDCRRVDIMIGETQLWGRGYGSEAIDLLAGYAFAVEGADMVFACDVADYNVASRRAFEKCGFELDAEYPAPPGSKAATNCDFVRRPGTSAKSVRRASE